MLKFSLNVVSKVHMYYAYKLRTFILNKLLPAAELQIQKRKLKQRPTNRLQPQPQNVLCMSPKIFLEFSSFRTRVP